MDAASCTIGHTPAPQQATEVDSASHTTLPPGRAMQQCQHDQTARCPPPPSASSPASSSAANCTSLNPSRSKVIPLSQFKLQLASSQSRSKLNLSPLPNKTTQYCCNSLMLCTFSVLPAAKATAHPRTFFNVRNKHLIRPTKPTLHPPPLKKQQHTPHPLTCFLICCQLSLPESLQVKGDARTRGPSSLGLASCSSSGLLGILVHLGASST